tara:strand:+ start:907 stop:1149 length:243 start_codon:yes stop_codon:yes gene_type:complete
MGLYGPFMKKDVTMDDTDCACVPDGKRRCFDIPSRKDAKNALTILENIQGQRELTDEDMTLIGQQSIIIYIYTESIKPKE